MRLVCARAGMAAAASATVAPALIMPRREMGWVFIGKFGLLRAIETHRAAQGKRLAKHAKKKPGQDARTLFGLVGVGKGSMLREVGHPPWPSRLVAAIIPLPITVPLKFPQSLDRHTSYRVIHENALDTAVVPVHGKMFHLGVIAAPLAIVNRGCHSRPKWSTASPHHIHKHRDIMQVMP